MKRILLLSLFLIAGKAWGYYWPIKPFTSQHQINSTLGEYRPGHFHSGVDIAAPDGTPVFSVISDTVLQYLPADPKNRGILTKDSTFWYIHLDNLAPEGTYIQAYTDTIGVIYTNQAHLHFREGENGARPIINPLRSGALYPYADLVDPVIDSVKFYRQGTNTQLTGLLNDKVDILTIAKDFRTSATGGNAGSGVSIYYIAFEIKDSQGNPLLYKKNIQFDSIPDNTLLDFVYEPSSSYIPPHFRYWVTNQPFDTNSTVWNWYWNTKQKEGAAEDVDADSIEEAKFPDG